MKPERVGIVVVGTGGIGKHHVRLWQETPGAEVVGVYDVLAEAARQTAERFRVPRVYASLAEAVAEPKAAVVDICTPNMLHKEGVLAALGAGKHCLCEKPLAASSRDIRAMIAARDRAGRLLMTAQHMRFEHRTRALKKLVDAGRLGQVYYGRAWWLRRRFAPATPGFLRRAQAGYGPGMDLGVHVLDLALHLLGHPPVRAVTGITARKLAGRPDIANQWGTYRPEEFEVEELAAGFLRFDNGAALVLEVSWLLNMVEAESYGLTLHGTEGGLQWPELKLAHVEQGLLVDTQVVSETGTDGHKNAMAALLEAIAAGGPSPVPAEESLRVLEILEALYRSAESGREVELGPAAAARPA